METSCLCTQRRTLVVAFCLETVLIAYTVVREQMDFQSKLLHHSSAPLEPAAGFLVATVRCGVQAGHWDKVCQPSHAEAQA